MKYNSRNNKTFPNRMRPVVNASADDTEEAARLPPLHSLKDKEFISIQNICLVKTLSELMCSL